LTSTNNQYNLTDRYGYLFQGKWIEGAAGRCTSGCSGYLQGNHDFGWHSVNSGGGTVITNTGYWNGKYTLLDKDLGEQRGGTAKVDYDFRGKGPYEYDLTSTIPDQ
jgi:hypothetical protein